MRAIGSLCLNVTAMGLAAVTVPICYYLLSRTWHLVLGRDGAFFGALGASLLCLGVARLVFRAADRLIDLPSSDDLARAPEPPDRWGHDWRAYTADVVRAKRWAYYRRTGQLEKLAALEAEERGRPNRTACGRVQ